MGLYERLPYTNFHELNLDAILKVVASIPDMIKDEVASALSTFEIPNGSITTAKLADSAVTSGKIANGGVGNIDLASGAVSTGKILNGAVTIDKLSDGSVSFNKLTTDFGMIYAGASGGQITVESGAASTPLASLNLDAGTYILLPWVFAYGSANSLQGTIDANISSTAGSTTGYDYGARWVANVPECATATATSFTWPYVRSFSSDAVVYINLQHTLGVSRNFRAGIRAVRIA